MGGGSLAPSCSTGTQWQMVMGPPALDPRWRCRSTKLRPAVPLRHRVPALPPYLEHTIAVGACEKACLGAVGRTTGRPLPSGQVGSWGLGGYRQRPRLTRRNRTSLHTATSWGPYCASACVQVLMAAPKHESKNRPGAVPIVDYNSMSNKEQNDAKQTAKLVGKHDGKLNAMRYFRCPPRTGIFVRPMQLVRLY
jgi:hypothetical protein